MSVESTLERVGRDVAAGDYGKARDRLHGLVAARPGDLELRRRLGRVYLELQYPAMAGRYWYLEEDRTPEMAAAVLAFEAECGRNPVRILRALKFRGDPEALPESFARARLLELQRRAREEFGYDFEFGRTPRAGGGVRDRPQTLTDRLVGVGCFLAACAAMVVMVVGLVTVIRWLVRLIG